MNAIELIKSERDRQVSVKKFSIFADDRYRSGELIDAALSYSTAAAKQARGHDQPVLKGMAASGEVPWPWQDHWWKPSNDPIRNLVKAAALIAAEIERLQRVEESNTPN